MSKPQVAGTEKFQPGPNQKGKNWNPSVTGGTVARIDDAAPVAGNDHPQQVGSSSK
jgi:hypothetical protein